MISGRTRSRSSDSMQAPDKRYMRTRRHNTNRRNALRSLKRRDVLGLLILGDVKTGKSALAERWCKGVYHEAYTPTVEEFYNKSYRYLGQSVSVGLIDLTGSGAFPAMLDLYHHSELSSQQCFFIQHLTYITPVN